MMALLQTRGNTQHLWMIAAALGIGLLAITGFVVFLMRRFLQSSREVHQEEVLEPAPRTQERR